MPRLDRFLNGAEIVVPRTNGVRGKIIYSWFNARTGYPIRYGVQWCEGWWLTDAQFTHQEIFDANPRSAVRPTTPRRSR